MLTEATFKEWQPKYFVESFIAALLIVVMTLVATRSSKIRKEKRKDGS